MPWSGRTGPEPKRWGRGGLSEKGANVLPNKNYLLNGSTRHWSQGTADGTNVGVTADTTGTAPVNDDEVMTADMWRFLVNSGDGNDTWDINKDTSTKPLAAHSSIQLLAVASGPSIQCGISQILESDDTSSLFAEAGGVCSFSFQASSPTGDVSKLRAAVLSSADGDGTCTKDLIGTYGGSGSDHTWVTGTPTWTQESVADQEFTMTNSFQTFSIEGVAIDTASTTNVAVIVWVDDVDLSVGDVVNIGNLKLEAGSAATVFQHEPMGVELAAIKRHFEQFNWIDAADQVIANTNTPGTGNAAFLIPFVEKRIVPTATSSVVGTFTTADDWDATPEAADADSIALSTPTRYGVVLDINDSGEFVESEAIWLVRDGSDQTFLRIDATVGA